MNTSILIVEDNPINQRLLELMFRHLGYYTKTVNNGLDAVSEAKENSYDIIMMDVEMPVMNGIEATRRIRNELPEEAQPVIVAVTASTIYQANCFEAGMDEYISKPIDMRKLRHLLANRVPQHMIA